MTGLTKMTGAATATMPMMKTMRRAKTAAGGVIFLATGGTGGHVFPAVAVAEKLLGLGLTPVFITDGRGAQIIRAATPGAKHYRIAAASPYGGSIIKRGANIALLGIGFLQTCFITLMHRPRVVIGFGSYASAAPVLLCRMAGRGVMLHEQNAFFGRANAFLAKLADVIALSWENTANIPDDAIARTVLCGMPVRDAFTAIGNEEYAPPLLHSGTDDAITILIVGGSLGAKVFGDTVPEAMARLPEAVRGRLHIIHQARQEQIKSIRARYAHAKIHAEVLPFITDMAVHMRRAHLVICRAGASFIAELAAAGRPAILVPYPHAMDDHQRVNAEAVADAGGGWCISEDEMSAGSLAGKIASLIENPRGLMDAARAMRGHGQAGAAASIAAHAQKLGKAGRRS